MLQSELFEQLKPGLSQFARKVISFYPSPVFEVAPWRAEAAATVIVAFSRTGGGHTLLDHNIDDKKAAHGLGCTPPFWSRARGCAVHVVAAVLIARRLVLSVPAINPVQPRAVPRFAIPQRALFSLFLTNLHPPPGRLQGRRRLAHPAPRRCHGQGPRRAAVRP